MVEEVNSKKEEPKEKVMTFWDHLEELRWHIVRSFLAILILAIVAFLNRTIIFDLVILAPKDSDFITNYYYTILGNRDFFLNAVNWLSEKDEGLASRGRSPQAPMSILFLTENESRLVFWSSVVIEPLIILLIGLSVIFWRRLKR